MKKITVMALLLVVTAATIPARAYAHGDEGEVNLANGNAVVPILATSPIGQEFILAASPLGAVDVRLSVHGSGVSYVTLKIWEGRIDSAKGPIATAAQPVASGVPAGTPEWVHFDLNQAVSVDTTGQTYVLELEAEDINPYWALGYSYLGGDAIVFENSFSNMDFAFKTYTTVDPPPLIVIPGAPDLDRIADQSVEAGESLLVSLWASDPEGDGLTLGASGLPAFAALTDRGDGTGYIEFAPGLDDAGLYPINVTVFDGALGDTESFTLRVYNVNRAPVLDPIADQSVNEGDTLLVSLSASDPDGDRLTLSTTGLPPFAALIDGGAGTDYIEYTPGFDDAGLYPIYVTVYDGAMGDTESFTLRVDNVNPSDRDDGDDDDDDDYDDDD